MSDEERDIQTENPRTSPPVVENPRVASGEGDSPAHPGAGKYGNYTGFELYEEADERGIPNAADMSDDELRTALEASDAQTFEVSDEAEGYIAPCSPTKGAPAPIDQPGRLGAVEADPPPDPVPMIQRAGEAVDRDEGANEDAS